VILEEGDRISLQSLPERIVTGRRGPPMREGGRAPDARESAGTLEDIERDYLIKVLEETGWQKKKASTILGINSSTLYRKIQRYGLEPKMADVNGGEEEE
jgi:transcriptional regulator of acetoin/glycerol metabolism